MTEEDEWEKRHADEWTEWGDETQLPKGPKMRTVSTKTHKFPEMAEKQEQTRVNYSQWLKRGVGTYLPTDNAQTVAEIESGVYNIRHSDNIGTFLVKKDLHLDELIKLPSKDSDEVLSSIKTFWLREAKFKEYGYAYKRGILLYGAPGGGKTSLINLLCRELIESYNGTIFTITSDFELGLYSSFMPEIYRTIEPTRKIICIIEDIDGLCQSKDTETKLINVLDGIEQLENAVYIATTNYMERLSTRITNRPNRFDRRIHVEAPNEECRRLYFEHKLKEEDLKVIDLEKWVKETRGMSMAHLGEVIKSIVILGNTFEETMKALQEMKTTPLSRNYNQEFEQKLGFGVGNGQG